MNVHGPKSGCLDSSGQDCLHEILKTFLPFDKFLINATPIWPDPWAHAGTAAHSSVQLSFPLSIWALPRPALPWVTSVAVWLNRAGKGIICKPSHRKFNDPNVDSHGNLRIDQVYYIKYRLMQIVKFLQQSTEEHRGRFLRKPWVDLTPGSNQQREPISQDLWATCIANWNTALTDVRQNTLSIPMPCTFLMSLIGKLSRVWRSPLPEEA